jgi:hypothetical protein
MNELLATRYRLLFESYAVGDSGPVVMFKGRIVEWNTQNGGILRPDASLFLLVNLDQLIIRPYFGDIESGGTQLLPLPSGLSADEWVRRAQQATELILGQLEKGAGEISAHDVLQVIDINWNTLAASFGWG